MPPKPSLKLDATLRGSIYQQKGRATLTVAFTFTDPGTGRKLSTYRSAADVEEANAILRELNETAPEQHREELASPTLFREVASDWLNEKDPKFDRGPALADGHFFTEKVVTAKTWRGYVSEIKTHLIPTLGDRAVTDITRSDVQAFLQALPHLTSQMHDDQAISHSIVLKVYRRLECIFRYAQVNEYMTHNPMLGNPMPDRVRRSTRHAAEIPPAERALQVHEVDALLAQLRADYPDHPAYAARFQLGAETGLRQAEVCGLTWDRLDLRRGVVNVHQQLVHEPWEHGCGPIDPATGTTPCTVEKRRSPRHRRARQLTAYQCPARTGGGWYIDTDTKSHQQRYVAMTDELSAVLRDLYGARPAEPKRTKAEAATLARRRSRSRYDAADADLVFTARQGGHISKALDNTTWHLALVRAGLPSAGRTVHALRHTAATQWVRAGLTLADVMKLLGHSSLKVLQDYYGGVEAASPEAAAKLADYLRRMRLAN